MIGARARMDSQVCGLRGEAARLLAKRRVSAMSFVRSPAAKSLKRSAREILPSGISSSDGRRWNSFAQDPASASASWPAGAAEAGGSSPSVGFASAAAFSTVCCRRSSVKVRADANEATRDFGIVFAVMSWCRSSASQDTASNCARTGLPASRCQDRVAMPGKGGTPPRGTDGGGSVTAGPPRCAVQCF